MMQPHALEPGSTPCCLPTPYRISHFVAGMAFNFSKIEMSHSIPHRKPPQQSARVKAMAAPQESA